MRYVASKRSPCLYAVIQRTHCKNAIDLNLFHAVRASRTAVPHMAKRGGGSIVTISSISGWKPANRGRNTARPKRPRSFSQARSHGNWQRAISASILYAPGRYFSPAAVGNASKTKTQSSMNYSARENFPHSGSARILKSPMPWSFSRLTARVGSMAHPSPWMARRAAPRRFEVRPAYGGSEMELVIHAEFE